MTQRAFYARNGLISGNLSVNTTNLAHGTDVLLSATDMQVMNSTANSVITRLAVRVSNSTSFANVSAALFQVANSTVSSNLSPTGLYVGNASVNVIANGTNILLGSAFIANSLGLYHTGTINAASYTVGATFTANATLVNAAAINITGQTNTVTLFVTTSANIGTLTVANATGIWTQGLINSAGLSVGTNFTVNSSLTNAVALNVGVQTNTATLFVTTSANVGTAVVANATGLWTTGIVNAVTHSAGPNFTANATLVNTAAINIVGQINTATFFATTSANVGANVLLSISQIAILGTSTNTVINSSAFSVNGNIVALTSGNQNLTGGFSVTAYNLNTGSAIASFTVDPLKGQYQYGTANSAFTITAPATDGGADIYLLNGTGAGTITFTGFTVGTSTGDTYAVTAANKYILSIRRINTVSTYTIKAIN